MSFSSRPPTSPRAVPQELIAAAWRLIDLPEAATAGLWPRAAAILARQALEHTLHTFLAAHAPGAQAAPFTTQLILLRALHPNPTLAARAAYTWSALSAATHHQGYELNPTAPTLRAWLQTVYELVRATP